MFISIAVRSAMARIVERVFHCYRHLGGLQFEAVLTHRGGTILIKFQVYWYTNFSRRVGASILPGTKLSPKVTLPSDEGESLLLDTLSRLVLSESCQNFCHSSDHKMVSPCGFILNFPEYG